jgi:succinate--hydroxymethylglutarate CoA-transferase
VLISQIASLANIGSNYLIAGQEAVRLGTSHPSIVPYEVFSTSDSHIMLAAGNDNQFALLCSAGVMNKPEWSEDERFQTNVRRVENRDHVVGAIGEVLAGKTTAEWCALLEGKG